MAKADETVIAWTPAAYPGRGEVPGQVGLAPRPPHSAVDRYGRWVYATNRGQSAEAGLAQIFMNFHTMVVRDGIDPQDAHEALLGIDEYRAAISPDIPGADTGASSC